MLVFVFYETCKWDAGRWTLYPEFSTWNPSLGTWDLEPMGNTRDPGPLRGTRGPSPGTRDPLLYYTETSRLICSDWFFM